MRRFVLIGCGGSGGATLQFVMDQLRADLAELGRHTLPGGWQFVHIDVPISPPGDAGGYPLPPSVDVQGGTYVPLSYGGATYPNVAQPVQQRLAEHGRVGELVRWRPNPDAVNVAISEGAGQYRAVGRMLTLNQAARVQEQLAAAFTRLQGNSIDELRELARAISPETAADVGRAPIVLVVSSMAGGAGASMVLDVCRMLSTIPNVSAESTALFLYTAEVFGTLAQHMRVGVEANAAAMIGELIASQSGAAGADAEVLKAVGVPLSDTAGRVPFGRVIPIGAKIGSDGAWFGDGSRGGVYRGIGRGLASLMLSGPATQGFTTVAVENPTVPSFPRTSLGWGVDTSRLAWGAFGYASVDLGRDRYAEYAAQRLARVAVDRLVDGRRRPGDERSASEWSRDIVASEWDRFCASVRLPVGSDPANTESWVTGMRRRDADEAARTISDRNVGRLFGRVSDVDAEQLAATLPVSVQAQRQAIEEAVDAQALRWAFEWFLGVREALPAEVAELVAAYGFGPAVLLLRELERRSIESAAVLREAARSWRPRSVAELDKQGLGTLRLIRGPVNAGHGALAQLRNRHEADLRAALGAAFADKVSLVLADVVDGLLVPLRRAVEDAAELCRQARAVRAEATGQALLRTTSYVAWPSGAGAAPERFAQAHNEILLTSSDGFEPLFRGHVEADGQARRALAATGAPVPVSTVRDSGLPFDEALDDVVAAVLLGSWPTIGARPDFPVFQVGTRWWPGVFRQDPRESGGRQVPAQRAQVTATLTVAGVLDRSRAYVARPKEAFHGFVGQSLADYLSDRDVGQLERRRRSAELRSAFGRALTMARPLVAVNPQTVAHLYAGRSVQNYYSFSALPLPAELATELESDLRATTILPATLAQFSNALNLGQASAAKRIDLFGSHEPFSPVVFTSLLEPVARRWAQLSAEARPGFWTWRRARRLPGAVPAGDAHRLAMVGGWYVARLTGLLRHPGERHSPGAAIFDDDAGTWVQFPDPLLTMPAFWYGQSLDCLPAVLEAMSIALARCHDSPELRPLRPYRLLREMYDDSDTAESITTGPAARRRLAAWIHTGQAPAGIVPPARHAGRPGDPPATRYEALLGGLTATRDRVGADYLLPGELGAEGGGRFSRIRAETIDRVPLFHEVAADCYTALGELIEIVKSIDPTGGTDPYPEPIS